MNLVLPLIRFNPVQWLVMYLKLPILRTQFKSIRNCTVIIIIAVNSIFFLKITNKNYKTNEKTQWNSLVTILSFSSFVSGVKWYIHLCLNCSETAIESSLWHIFYSSVSNPGTHISHNQISVYTQGKVRIEHSCCNHLTFTTSMW